MAARQGGDGGGRDLRRIAVAGAIGLSAANLAIQVNKERAASDAGAANQKLGHFAHLPRSPNTQITDVDKTLSTGLNF